MNVAEVELMIQTAKDCDRSLVEAVWSRWHPRMIKAIDLVRSGKIGQITSIDASFTFPASIEGNYRLSPEMGGGALFDIGVYPLHAIAALGSNNASISKILKPYQRYVSSGEINSVVSDAPAEMKKIEEKYGSQSGVGIDHLDGLSVNGDTWWFNLRSSNTEPLLRLNVEAKTQARMEKVRDEVLKAIKGK